MIPALNSSLYRQRFLNNIARNPVVVVFRNKELTGRLNQPSIKRKAELAGYTDIQNALELMLALDAGSPAPESLGKDQVEANGGKWRIVEVTPDVGADCYYIVLSKIQ